MKDTAVCAAHTEKTCYTGSAAGYGCPWQVFPGGLVKNTYCGACLECLRTCPHDNVAINLRPFGTDLLIPTGRKLDEAFKAFVMLGSAIAYSAVMLGPWGALKSAAYSVETGPWAVYAAAFLVLVLGVLPGAFYVFVVTATPGVGNAGLKAWKSAESRLSDAGFQPGSPGFHALSRGLRVPGVRRQFVAFSYSLLPLGLAAWIAFTLSFVFANSSYLIPALSDPMGEGWNLFGTASVAWTPYLGGVVPASQVIVLLGGLLWSSSAALKIAEQADLSGLKDLTGLKTLPILAFLFLVTLALMALLV